MNGRQWHYCPSCDEFSDKARAHFLCRHLTWLAWVAVALFLVGPSMVLYAYVTSLP